MNEALRASILDMPATQGNLYALLALTVEFAASPEFNSLRSDDIEAEKSIEDVRTHLHEAFSIALDLRLPTWAEREAETYRPFDKDAAWTR